MIKLSQLVYNKYYITDSFYKVVFSSPLSFSRLEYIMNSIFKTLSVKLVNCDLMSQFVLHTSERFKEKHNLYMFIFNTNISLFEFIY